MNTNTPVMTFHESYGEIPVALLALMKLRNVSPADFYTMEIVLGEGNFEGFYDEIVSHSDTGMYRPDFY